MTSFDTMLPNLRGTLVMLITLRATDWGDEANKQRALLDRDITTLCGKILHLTGLPQRDDPPQR